VVKVDILTNGKPVPELAFICHASKGRLKGKKVVEKMKELIPRQQIPIALQAAVGKKVARVDRSKKGKYFK
jgi:GTP-binding protein LepA